MFNIDKLVDNLLFVHHTFQVPKMEVLSLIRRFLGWVFSYISRIHTAYIYIGEYLHFRYLKCLVICSGLFSYDKFGCGVCSPVHLA